MNLLESAEALGALRGVELACFARLGERARRVAIPSCALWAASASRAHAWRASLLEGLLPVSAGLPGLAELTVVPDGPLGVALARALPVGASAPVGREGPDEDGPSLIADLTAHLYPLLLTGYLRRLEAATPAADGPVVRILGRAVADLEVVQAEAALLLSRAAQAPRAGCKP